MINSQYQTLNPLWNIVGDAYLGVEAIKGGANAFVYLPPQPAERAEIDKKSGDFEGTRYAFRKRVATYENIFKPTIDDICGLMQKNRPRIRFGAAQDDESPQEVRNIEWRGNRYNDGVYGLKTRVNAAQALFGRYGMLLDVVTDEDGLHPQFCITEYPCAAILDGDYCESSFDSRKKLRWALLDESTRKFNPKTKMWIDWPKRRLVALDAEGRYYNAVFEGLDVNAAWAAFDLDYPVLSDKYELVYPTYQGEYLNIVPLTICNVDRLGLEFWQAPPYLNVAQVAIWNYMVDSWYKMALYQFATPTLVIGNAARESEDVRLGGVVWAKSGSGNPVSVQILETSGSGLGELRNAKDELKASLKYSSIRDLLDGAGANSSGDALKLRSASGTAAIATMDKTGARAIEEQIIFAAMWAGASYDEAYERISFEADTTYLGAEFQISAVVSFMRTNKDARLLSRQNAYSILEKTFPGVISNFEDNEAQLMTEEDAAYSSPATDAILRAISDLQSSSDVNEEVEDENDGADDNKENDDGGNEEEDVKDDVDEDVDSGDEDDGEDESDEDEEDEEEENDDGSSDKDDEKDGKKRKK